MNSQRISEAYEIIEAGKEQNGKRALTGGVAFGSKYITEEISRNSAAVKQLEAQGFKVIFPAEIQEEQLGRLDEGKRAGYEVLKNDALIIDMQSKEELSIDFANEIIEHYNKLGARYGYGGNRFGCEEGKQSLNFLSDSIGENANKDLQQILNEIGFEATLIEEHGKTGIKVQADMPRQYPVAVSKRDYSAIFDKTTVEQEDLVMEELREMQQHEAVVDKDIEDEQR